MDVPRGPIAHLLFLLVTFGGSTSEQGSESYNPAYNRQTTVGIEL